MAQNQITFGTTKETGDHIQKARKVWPDLVSDNLLGRRLAAEWYELYGSNHDQLEDILSEAAKIWPELKHSRGLLLRKIAVEWIRDRNDGRRKQILTALERIEEKVSLLLDNTTTQDGR